MRLIFKEETNYYNMCDIDTIPKNIELKIVLNIKSAEESVRHAIRGIRRLYFGSDEPNQKGIILDFGRNCVKIYSAEFTPEQIDYIFERASAGVNGTINQIVGELRSDLDRVDKKLIKIGA